MTGGEFVPIFDMDEADCTGTVAIGDRVREILISCVACWRRINEISSDRELYRRPEASVMAGPPGVMGCLQHE